MTILIAKSNIDIINNLLPKTSLCFKENTKNTCTFTVSKTKAKELETTARLCGYNPFALFAILN